MELRKDVKVKGIPGQWETNLSDADLSLFYFNLVCDPDFKNSQLEITHEPCSVTISAAHFYYKNIPFKDGFCLCMGFSDRLTVIYRTEAEWQVWHAHRAEVEELEAEQERKKQVEVLLFNSHDDRLSDEISVQIAVCDWPSVFALLRQRQDLWRSNTQLVESLDVAGQYAFEKRKIELDAETIDALVRIPDVEGAIRFLQEQDCDAPFFERFGESYFTFHFRRIEASLHMKNDPDWLERVRRHPEYEPYLSLTQKIHDASIARFPSNGHLLKRVVLFWENHDRIPDAIVYCNLGAALGLDDNTKTGFRGRLRRLENKLKKMENAPSDDGKPPEPIMQETKINSGKVILDNLTRAVMHIVPDNCHDLVLTVRITSKEFTGSAGWKIHYAEREAELRGESDDDFMKDFRITDPRVLAAYLHAYYTFVRSQIIPADLRIPLMDREKSEAYLNEHLITPYVYHFVMDTPETPDEWQIFKTGTNKKGD